MRLRALVALVAALTMLIPVAAGANNGNGGRSDYQVSGGGQVIADASLQGPGDTIAFVAQRFADRDPVGQTNPNEDDETFDIYPARGQLQVVSRANGRGRDQVLFHGRVDCIVPDMGSDNVARFGGTGFDPRTRVEAEFVVDVTDADEQGNDMISFRRLEEDEERNTACDDDFETELRETRLARGNVKIHDRR